MRPKSVSATSLTTARGCLSRYYAENIEYARGFDNPHGKLGGVVHSALQDYVQRVYIDKVEQPSAESLATLYELHYMKAFGVPVDGDLLWEAGKEMMERWSDRETEHFTNRTPITLEQKKFFMLQTTAGDLKVNYILDRFDQIGPAEDGVYAVIDYKSQFKNLNERELRKLLQPNLYALAMFLEMPHIKELQVTFDMLRYDLITIVITKDEARQTMKDMVETIQLILDTPDDNVPETLNTACNYCIRKATCKTLLKNIEVGGLFSLDLNGQVDLITEIELKMKGMKALKDELETVVEETLGQEQTTELFTGRSRAHFTVRGQNTITSVDEVRRIVGDPLFFRYGKTDIGIGQFDKLRKDPTLTDEQREALAPLKRKGYADPKLNFENNRSEADTAAVAPELTGNLAPAVARAPIVGLED